MDFNLESLWDTTSNVNLTSVPRFDFWSLRGRFGWRIQLPRIVPFSVIGSLALTYLFALWLTLVWWVREDAQKRTKDKRLVNLATALVILFNFPGMLLYFLWRPPTFEEVKQAEMEEEIMRLELEQLREWKKTKKT